jgi:hypothetical protein
MLPNQAHKEAEEELNFLMGRPIDINPLDALLWCIRIVAGEVQWLSQQMAEITSKEEWTEFHPYLGRQLHLFARERQAATDRLARYSQQAVSLGLHERAVRLAEQYGEMLANLLNGIFTDLALTPAQQEQLPVIVRRHLLAINHADIVVNGNGKGKELVVDDRASSFVYEGTMKRPNVRMHNS